MTVEQPKNFGFGEDEAMLRDSAFKFFSDNLPADKLHAMVAANSDPHRENECVWDQDLWQQVVELGWTAVCVPEEHGGIGMPLVAAVALVEQAGRAAFPSPLQTTLMTAALLNAAGSEEAGKALARIAEGVPMSMATSNASGGLEPADTSVTVDGTTLNGSSHFVQEARKVQSFVVSAQNDQGVGLYLVEADTAGLEITPDTIIDLTRDQATLKFSNVSAIELAAPGQGEAALTQALPTLLCLASADMVGAGEWLLQTTAEYASTREQFDRPIGFFQAIKHPLVNVMVEIDNAKSLTYNAACAIEVGADDALQLARMAKAQASDMAVFSGGRAVQFHGGIGFTWECFVQMFFKRQMHSQVWLGDGPYQRRKLADILVGAVAAA